MGKTIGWLAASAALICLNVISLNPGVGYNKEHGELEQHFGFPVTYRLVEWRTKEGIDHQSELQQLISNAPLTVFDAANWEAVSSEFRPVLFVADALVCLLPVLVVVILLIRKRAIG